MTALRVGASQIVITPPIGTPMAGYVQRTGVSEGIIDDLCMQAVSFQHGEDSLVLLSLDVVQVDEDFGERVAEHLGLSSAQVIVAATHTHSGPQLMRSHDVLQANDPDDEAVLRAMWLRQAVGACRWAMRSARPVSVAWGTTIVSDVGGNRNHVDVPVDQDLVVVSFRDAHSDKPVVTIINYACHPTVLGAANLCFSTDFVGPLRRALGSDPTSYAASPERPVVVFLNGAAGDISTRFYRRSQSDDEAVRLGTMAAQIAARAPLVTAPTRMDWKLTAAQQEIALKQRRLPDEHDAHMMAKQAEETYKRAVAEGRDASGVRIARTRFEGALRQARMSAMGTQQDAPPPLSVRLWTLGPLAVVAVPAELFSSLGRRIKQNSLAVVTLLVGYSNGNVGYIPDAEGHSDGSYESLSTAFESGEGEVLCDHICTAWQRVAAKDVV